MIAYILLTVKPGTSEEVVKSLRKVSGVKRADSVYGQYDAIVTIEVPSMEKLAELIYKVIKKNSNITRTETTIALE